LKKRTKKLLTFGASAAAVVDAARESKVFCFFFSKKKTFLHPKSAWAAGSRPAPA
jgi:hypothetical protein